MSSNISFKSNIRFVNNKDFKKIARNSTKIGFLPGEKFIQHLESFHTIDIKSCTAGGVTFDGGKVTGFHILDDYINHKIINQICEIIWEPNQTKGLIIGSKNIPGGNYPYSLDNFEMILKNLSKKIKNLSIFQQQMFPLSQSNIHYNCQTDTWTICHKFIRKDNSKRGFTFDFVKNVSDLKQAFKKIRIAKGDKLYIGDKKIKTFFKRII